MQLKIIALGNKIKRLKPPRNSLFFVFYLTLYLSLYKDYILYVASHSNRLSI
jgi:hypothetical protein